MKMVVQDITNTVPKDEFGPEMVFKICPDYAKNQPLGWLVIDNTSRGGIGKGGTAIDPRVNLGITLRKARNMTWKEVFCNPIGKETKYPIRGGAKGGIKANPHGPYIYDVLRAWLLAIGKYEFALEKFLIPDKYIFDLDVGGDEWMTRLAVKVLKNRKVTTAKPHNMGGIPYDELGLTGFGLIKSLEAQAMDKNINLSACTAAVQGFGAVGGGFAMHLDKLSGGMPKIVAASDWAGTICNPRGLGTAKLLELRDDKKSNPRKTITNYQDAKKIPLGSELFLPVDILILAYGEDQITINNVKNIKAKIILQGANMGITPEAEQILHKKMNITVLPDFVENAGAATASLVEEMNGTIEQAFTYVAETISHNVRHILNLSKEYRLLPRQVAMDIAKNEIRKAMRK